MSGLPNNDLYIMDADEVKAEFKKCEWRIQFVQQQIDGLKAELEKHNRRAASCHVMLDELRTERTL